VAVSPSQQVWVTNATLTPGGGALPNGPFYVSNIPIGASTFKGYGNLSAYTSPAGVAIDGAGNAYIADSGATYIHKITALGTPPAVTEYYLQGPSTVANCIQNIQTLTVDSQTAGYNVWAASANTSTTYGLCEIQNAATVQAPTITVETGLGQVGNLSNPGALVIGANGNVWIANKGSYAEQFTAPPSASAYGFLTGGGATASSAPRSLAVDGDNNVWVSNAGTNNISSYHPIKTATVPNDTVVTATSPSAGWTAGGLLNTPTSIKIDPSGDVWVANTGLTANAAGVSYSITEIIGAAAPAYTSIANAALNNKLGQRP
jgi:hypothetical protein